tara:strand:+ start:81 stop:581 length:501 start_codon:yes stop_codon:yes gene_type:complete
MRDVHASVVSRFIPMSFERILFRRARVAACSNPSNATVFSFIQKNGQRESPIRHLAVGAIVTTRRARTRRATKRFRRLSRAGRCRHLAVRLCARAYGGGVDAREAASTRATSIDRAIARARVSREGRRRAARGRACYEWPMRARAGVARASRAARGTGSRDFEVSH